MSGATTIAAVVGAVATVAKAMQKPPDGGKPQELQPPTLEKPPQPTKAPNIDAIRKNNATALTGPAAGNASTFLTGASGIDDASLNLGKNQLLGQ